MKTPELPHFPFYPRDFTSDSKVESMTTEEVGAYTLLLCKAWHESPAGTLPADDDVLAKWSRLPPGKWSRAKARVLAAFVVESDGRLHQKRMKEEHAKAVALWDKRVKASRSRFINGRPSDESVDTSHDVSHDTSFDHRTTITRPIERRSNQNQNQNHNQIAAAAGKVTEAPRPAGVAAAAPAAAAEAAPGDRRSIEALRALLDAGIGQPKASELAAMPHVTAEGVERKAKEHRKGETKNLLIHRIEHDLAAEASKGQKDQAKAERDAAELDRQRRQLFDDAVKAMPESLMVIDDADEDEVVAVCKLVASEQQTGARAAWLEAAKTGVWREKPIFVHLVATRLRERAARALAGTQRGLSPQISMGPSGGGVVAMRGE